MPQVKFTRALEQHLTVPEAEVRAGTVREALEAIFADNPRLRSYVVDDQGRLRKHVVIFIDGEMIQDRRTLGDTLTPTSEVYVMQALSGG